MSINSVRGAALAAAAIVAVLPAVAVAATNPIVINQASQSITLSNSVTTTAANSASEGRLGGAATLSSLQPRGAADTVGANGSLQIAGDRSRYVIGSLYGGANLGLLDTFSSLSFDYRVDNNGTPNAYNTPVVSFAIIDRGSRVEVTFEGVYNGVSNAEGQGWQVAGTDSLLFTNVRTNQSSFVANNPGFTVNGQGIVLQNGSQVNRTLSGVNSFFSDAAFVSGISIGSGGGFGTDFVGYVDNVRLGIGSDVNVINFEVPAAAAVPEPATWLMMIGGFGLAGGALRRRTGKLVSA